MFRFLFLLFSLNLAWLLILDREASPFESMTKADDSVATASDRASGAEEPADQESNDSLDRDYAEELPRIAPKSPAEALTTFEVADGFRIDQVAAEPQVTDPVACAFDAKGRLYVIEMRGYSEDEEEFLGRVRFLEDRDADGRFETSTVFVDKLSWPTAIICYDGGVFVGAAPNIFYFKDEDGDGQADQRRTVYEGFGRGNVQGLLNSFAWGLDHRIHGATSSSGATITCPLHPDREPLVLRGRDFAFDPQSLEIEPTSGGGQHGLSFNQWGEKFVCSNSNHAQFVIFEDRYMARNPFLAAPSPRESIAADGPQADVYRTSPVEPWRIVRTRLRKQGIVPGPVERGGKAAGYFTGATGITIYLGSDWPRQFYGWALVGDVGSNLVHRKRLVPEGLSYVAQRVDEKTEFLRSTDIWYRPVQMANAPDGGLYILDMYREVIEHPKSLHPVIKQHLDLTSGRDRGRIYRVVTQDFVQPAAIALNEAPPHKLVMTLDHPNGWHRQTAARLLYERQDASAVSPLQKLVQQGTRPEGRIHALYALAGLDALPARTVAAALHDPHPQVRRHAVRIAEELVPAESSAVHPELYSMTEDPDLHVRYQLAFTLGQLSGPQRLQALTDLIRRDGSDRHFQLAIMSSLADGSGDVLGRIARDESFRGSSNGKQWLGRLAAQIGRQQSPDDVAKVLAVLRELTEDAPAVMQQIVQNLNAKEGTALARQVAASTGGQAAEFMTKLLAEARATAIDKSAPVEARTEAILQLQLGSFAESRVALSNALHPTRPADLQIAALKTLASYKDPGVAEVIIDRWKGLTPQLRSRAGEVLFSRDIWLEPLIAAIEQETIFVGDLQPSRLNLLASHHNPEIAERAKQLATGGSTARTEIVENYRETLEMPGDVARGRLVFKKTCAACHRVEEMGHPIGPSLVAMKNRGPEAILTNVLAPNREVNPQYLNYIVLTNDGRSLSGIIAAETATSVTLKRADNATDTILRVDIDEMRSTGMSLMPEGLEKQIDKQSMADLFEYLRQTD